VREFVDSAVGLRGADIWAEDKTEKRILASRKLDRPALTLRLKPESGETLEAKLAPLEKDQTLTAGYGSARTLILAVYKAQVEDLMRPLEALQDKKKPFKFNLTDVTSIEFGARDLFLPIAVNKDKAGCRGYAVGFEGLVEFVHSAAPQNRFIEEAVRQEMKMFPKQALRELIANALVHQDFLTTGASVMIEMYDDRVEISNPGLPPIEVERFIDEYRSRNERLADLMRRLGICEEKGSGIDKVISASELFQLPAPDFRASDLRTTAVLFAHQELDQMDRNDRIRACYQHCCLLYVMNRQMNNQSLRDRFKLSEKKVATVTAIITATVDSGKIKLADPTATSTRYRSYIPFWA
jgi:hypothetical protein